jgi:CPA2 family monovalent cation:H+ antiporter-2
MTLSQLAVTVAVLGVLGLLASRFGLSAIPAYLVAGLLLGPNEPEVLTVIRPSEVTEFVAELGVIFLLFFLGLEFSLDRILRSGRHFGIGGSIDLALNAGVGLLLGWAAFGMTFAALVFAALVYVSSSAVAVKGLIDFRRLADDETNLVLAILVFEDLVIALALGFVATGGTGLGPTFALVAKAIGFIAASLLASRYVARLIERFLDRLDLEFFLLFSFALVIGMSAIADRLGLSEAIGALMAGVILADTSIRADLEERFFSFRDLFAALFFFVFGLTIDLDAIGSVGWLLALAVGATVTAKILTGILAGQAGGFTRRQALNAGAALVAHGEFTIIVAQLASRNDAIPSATRADLVAFAGLYVLATATIGVVLMKESKRIGRRIFPRPRIEPEVPWTR